MNVGGTPQPSGWSNEDLSPDDGGGSRATGSRASAGDKGHAVPPNARCAVVPWDSDAAPGKISQGTGGITPCLGAGCGTSMHPRMQKVVGTVDQALSEGNAARRQMRGNRRFGTQTPKTKLDWHGSSARKENRMYRAETAKIFACKAGSYKGKNP